MSIPPDEPNCGALGGGGEVADGAAGADQPAAVAGAARRPRRAARRRERAGAADRPCAPAGPGRRRRGTPRSCARRRAGTRRDLDLVAVLDADQLHAAAADVEHDAVGQRRGVDRRDVAVVRLLRRPRAPRPRSRSPRARAAGTRRGWWRRGSRWSRTTWTSSDAEAVGAAEALEDRERLQPAGHRALAQRPGRGHALADPDGLVELVGALPPAGRLLPS